MWHYKTFLLALLGIYGIYSINSSVAYLNSPKRFQPAQTASLTLVSSDRDPNPVVNENNQLQLLLIDSAGQVLQGATFSSGSPEVASVDPQTGVVTGVQRGFATITAHWGGQSVSNFVVVSRVESGRGVKVEGKTGTDLSGAIYLSDPLRHVIFRRDRPTTDPVVFAGQSNNRGHVNGVRTQARFAGPIGVAVDNRAQGGIYIADTLNHSIRKIGFDDTVSTVLGSGVTGINRDDVTPFDRVAFNSPQGVAVDSGGNLVIADTDNHAVYIADFQAQQLRLLAGSPGQAGKADGSGRQALFNRPTALAVRLSTRFGFESSQKEGVFVADSGNNRIRFVGFDGSVETIGPLTKNSPSSTNHLTNQTATEFVFNNPQSLSTDSFGNIYVTDATGVRLITEPVKGSRQIVSLAQSQVSFQRAVSVSVRATQTFVLDAQAASEGEAVKVVTVGAPEITGLSQDFDGLNGGSRITIFGHNFAPESKLVIGDTEVEQVDVESATKISFVVPPQKSPGLRNLTVLTRGGLTQTPFFFYSPSLGELEDGEITTMAGGTAFVGDGGVATDAVLRAPRGLAIDAAGRLLVADTGNQRVRSVDMDAKQIFTVAGTGNIGNGNPNGISALTAELTEPSKVAVDSDGNFYTNDYATIVRVNVDTGKIQNLVNTEIIASFTLDAANNIYYTELVTHGVFRVDAKTGRVRRIAGNGQGGYAGDGGDPLQASFLNPADIAIDKDGNIYIADAGNSRIRRIDADLSKVRTVAGNGEGGFEGEGVPATEAVLNEPYGVAVDAGGNIYISDTANSCVRVVDAQTGLISTLAGVAGRAGFGGDNGPAREALLNRPTGLMISGDGNVYIADTGSNRVRMVVQSDGGQALIYTVAGKGSVDYLDGKVPAVAGRLDAPQGVTLDQNGDLLVADTFASRVRLIDTSIGMMETIAGLARTEDIGDGGPALNAFLQTPVQTLVDSKGQILILDPTMNRVRRILLDGTIETYAGKEGYAYGGDGGPAKEAIFNVPYGMAFDLQGNLLIADTGNHRIRRINAITGIVETIAGTGTAGFAGDGGQAKNALFNEPTSVAIDTRGNIYVGDGSNRRIRRIDAVTGIVTTIAGRGEPPPAILPNNDDDNLPALQAVLSRFIGAMVFDSNGELVFTDTYHDRICRIDKAGIFHVISGSGNGLVFGDGGLARDAGLRGPTGLAIDKNDNLYIADAYNNAIRVIKNVTRDSQPRVTITAVNYTKPNLTITGSGFVVNSTRVSVNGVDVSAAIRSVTATEILLKGNKKKLALSKGANQVVVSVGAASEAFVFNF